MTSIRTKKRIIEVMLIMTCLTRTFLSCVFIRRPVIEAISGIKENNTKLPISIASVVPKKRSVIMKIVPIIVAATQILRPAFRFYLTRKFVLWLKVSLSTSGNSTVIMKNSP